MSTRCPLSRCRFGARITNLFVDAMRRMLAVFSSLSIGAKISLAAASRKLGRGTGLV